jgi:hypothetical protein
MTKSPGRPRLYDSASAKVEAFRKRQESSGYLRKEILVTQDTWDQVTALARSHSVSISDAASGLLEHGLSSFSPELQPGTSALSALNTRGLPGVPCLAVGGVIARLGSRPTEPTFANNSSPLSSDSLAQSNPITQFFSKRKDSSNV